MTCTCPIGIAAIEGTRQLKYAKPMVWGDFNGNKFLLFFDTGASVNLMGEDLYLKHFGDQNLMKTSQQVCDIHTQKIDIMGSMQISFSMGGQRVTDNILVAGGVNLGNVILWGHPACIKNNISLCPPKR